MYILRWLLYESHPIQIQFCFHSWHLLRGFDHYIINIQDDDFKFFEGWFKFDGSSIQDETKNKTWVLIGTGRSLQIKEFLKHIKHALVSSKYIILIWRYTLKVQ